MKTPSRMLRLVSAVALALGLAVTAPAWAGHQSRAVGGFDADESRDIEEIVREYILNHPEVMFESVQKMRDQKRQEKVQAQRDAAGAVKPVNRDDHILGSRDAPVKLVEFSDFECPFCKRFHPTMKRLMDEYGKDGKVAWVYRHFPLDSLHSKARKEAQASECANELGGNEAFWAYADKLYEKGPANNRLDLALLPDFAEEIGLDRGAFETCLEGDARGGKYAAHIEADVQDAIASGGTGTPYSLVIAPNGTVYPVSGAMPYAALTALIDAALKGEL